MLAYETVNNVWPVSFFNKQTPLFATQPTASAIVQGQMLSRSLLTPGVMTNAAGGTVTGRFAFATPTIVPNAGSTNVYVTVTPVDVFYYNNATTTVNVTVRSNGTLILLH